LTQNDDLGNKIVEWLNSQGYPLEMAVAQLFRNSGFWALQSDVYQDKESGKKREIDIVAHFNKNSDIVQPLNFGFSIGCCVECKLGKDKPWLLLTSKSLPIHDIRDLAITTDYGFDVLTKAISVSKNSTLSMTDSISCGYGLTQAFTSGQDVPYQAVMEAIKATFSKMQEFDEMIDSSWGLNIPIFFPVVVFDGRFFETQLDNNGELVIQEIDLGIVSWNVLSPTYPEKYVFISTKIGLEKLIEKIKVFSDTLVSLDKEFEAVAIEFFKKEGFA
jgi:hypothetical protein